MKKKEDFLLVGHLQVMDEPLSSLYTDSISGKFFLFVRICDGLYKEAFVLSEVKPASVLEYMNGHLGLKSIFSSSPTYYYKRGEETTLATDLFSPLSQDQAVLRINNEYPNDMFDRRLAYRSVSLKNYLRNL